ncbi:MAG TPA: aminoglycoside phosphotransferase family protein [Micromonosporaceae bacterium]|nr:aminoglycoside phosphotransferase family protein [Micromonosporaceae bacterium]
MRLDVPAAMARNATDAWGADGARWLAALPDLVAAVARDWDLAVGDPFPLSYHWVCAVTRADGTPAVLKLGPPEPGHLAVEAATLEFLGGRGAVRLLAHDPARGALLLERAPGPPVSALGPDRDAEATDAVIAAIRGLRRPAPAGGPWPELAAHEAESFAGHLRGVPDHPDLPHSLVRRAAAVFDELCASAPGSVLLHGDLHHDNVLAAEREPWLVIDPFGVIGDPGYEVGSMLYNPDPPRRDERWLALVEDRIERLADGLSMPVERVVAWGFVKAVLTDVWTAQDGGIRPSRGLDVATRLLPRLP